MATRFHTVPVRVNGKTLRAFRTALPRWYRRHHRQLPWRCTRDPYKIWVSEIMLQQTRADVVIAYYRRWCATFPTVRSVARAPYRRVLKLWEGLGYYSRAQNLHRAAKLMACDFRGQIPTTYDALLRLPGIGRYTAGAIASIAFEERVPVLDGNVARVLARAFGIRANVTKPAIQTKFWHLAHTLMPADNPGEFNQALMELGALVCIPRSPRCPSCSLAGICVANARSLQQILPNRDRKERPRPVSRAAAWVVKRNRLLITRRPATGLLANMWELPGLNRARFQRGRELHRSRHTITNHRITLRIYQCRLRVGVDHDPAWRWVTIPGLKHLPMPAAQRRAVQQILSAQD